MNIHNYYSNNNILGKHNPLRYQFYLYEENQRKIRKRLKIVSLTLLTRFLISKLPHGRVDIERRYYDSNGRIIKIVEYPHNDFDDEGDYNCASSYNYNEKGNIIFEKYNNKIIELIYENNVLIKQNIIEIRPIGKKETSISYVYKNNILIKGISNEIHYDKSKQSNKYFEKVYNVLYEYYDDLRIKKIHMPSGNIACDFYEEYKYDDVKNLVILIVRNLDKEGEWRYTESFYWLDEQHNLKRNGSSTEYKYSKNGLISFTENKSAFESFREYYFYSKSLY